MAPSGKVAGLALLAVVLCGGAWFVVARDGRRGSPTLEGLLAAGTVEASGEVGPGAALVPVATVAEEPPAVEDAQPARVAVPAVSPDALESAPAWLRRLVPDRYGTASDADLLALEELDLRGAKVTDADLWRLAELPNLARLGLRGTAITDAGIAALARLPLTALDLRGTAVSGACFASLPGAHLEALHLTETKVTEADLARLPPMPALRTLKLNFLALSDLTIESLGSQPDLRHVELDGTQLTDDGLRRLLALQPGLTRVEARNTRVSADLVAELARTRPGLEIVTESPSPYPR